MPQEDGYELSEHTGIVEGDASMKYVYYAFVFGVIVIGCIAIIGLVI